MEEEELGAASVVNDWNDQLDELPDQPPSVAEAKYVRLFALDVGGQQGHDQYVYLVPNGLAIVGLAPSHVLLHAYQHNSATELPQEQHRVSSTPADLGKHGALASAAAEHGVATSASGALHKSPDHGEQQGMQQPMSSVSVTMEQKQVGSDPASTRQGSDQLQAEESGSSRLQPSLLLCLDGPSLCCMQQQQQQQQIIVKAPAKDLLTLQGPQVLQKPEDVRQPKRHKGPSEPGATLPFPPDQLAAINFDIGKRTATQRQSGKKKAQGNLLDAHSVLCRLEGSNGTHIPVRAVAPGKLLEVNQRLQQSPSLALKRPLREGYIAILFPSEVQRAALVQSLYSVEQYMAIKGLTSKDLAQ